MTTIKPKLPRPKKCKQCGEKFQPTRSIQPCCSFKCELAFAHEHAKKRASDRKQRENKRVKVEAREARKAKREYIDNDKSHQTKLTQAEVNKWVRFRDDKENCISCGNEIKGGGYIGSGSKQAGHYRSAGGNPELRFNTLNIHLQCQRCNVQLSGNIAGYRPRLIEKIGIDKVEWIEGYHEPRKYTCDQLREIRAYYAKLTRDKKTDDSDRPFQ